jgi:hypothetical protein
VRAAAVGVADPDAVDGPELDFWGGGHRHAAKTPFSGRPSRPWIPVIDPGPVRYYAHLLDGEVHCTSNVLRDPSGAAPWWSAS